MRRAERLVVAVLAIAALLIVAGGWLLHDSMVRHRATADETLRDHAAYMSANFAGSAQSESWFGIRSLLRVIRRLDVPGAPAITLDSLRALALADAIGPGLPPLWPNQFMVGDTGAWRSLVRGAGADRVVDSVIRARLRRGLDTLLSFHGIVVPRGADTMLAFFERGVHSPWIAVEVPLPSFRKAVLAPPMNRLGYAFTRLRDSMHLATGDSLPPLAVRVRTPDGAVIYALGPEPGDTWAMRRPILPSLGASLHLAVLGPAVPVLMPGGYPPAPGPRVAIAVGIASLVLLAGAWLAWRTLALARMREEFTSTVPHELRTPLTNIQLWAETLLLDRARTADERRAALETITRETRRLVHMVENVLAFTRIGRQSVQVVRRREGLERLVADATSSFTPLFQAHRITPRMTVSGPRQVDVDGDAVRRILVNLIDNAIRHGGDGQVVSIDATHQGGVLTLTVEDEGPGVAPADRDRIWRPFERGATGGDGGTGIGLAVVHQLVAMHGGSATVRNGARGARFEIRLPAPALNEGGDA